MATKSSPLSTSEKVNPKPLLERQARVSDSGQFAVSMDALRELPSFIRDLKNVAQIREKLLSKR